MPDLSRLEATAERLDDLVRELTNHPSYVSLPPPRPTRKRKRKHGREPSVTTSSKRFQPSSSVISISSDDNDAPPLPSSSQADPEYWSQQPSYDSDLSDGELIALTQEEPDSSADVEPVLVDLTNPPVVDENRPAGDYYVPEPTLCPEQKSLLDLIMSGRNVFFTGSAGCGKSTVLKAAVKQLRELHRTVHIVAPTGRAALGVNGTTTWSYMGWTPAFHKLPLTELKQKSWQESVRKRLTETDVLIIDEISMVENHHLERMNEVMKHIRYYDIGLRDCGPATPAFGGVQLIITGDFCQLPPVGPFQYCLRCGLATEASTKWTNPKTVFKCHSCSLSFREPDKWAFKSAAWDEARLSHVHLNEIHRQSDRAFVTMLQKCRLGIPFNASESRTLLNHPCDVRNPTQLFGKNADVTRVNWGEFDKLPGPEVNYSAVDDYQWYQEKHEELASGFAMGDKGVLKGLEDHPLDTLVEMKLGALVMLRVNLDLGRGLVNGSQGIICDWEPHDPAKLPRAYKQDKSSKFETDILGGDFARLREQEVRKLAKTQRIKHWPVVQFHNGVRRTIYPWCVVNTLGAKEPYSLLYRTQVPLTLAWALSIHKSQGMTLNRVVTNLTGAWLQALKYVALSRVTSIDGLRLDGGPRSLAVKDTGDGEVREFLLQNFGQELFERLQH